MTPARFLSIRIALLLLLLGPACWSGAQQQKVLWIDSPRDGSVVHPGDTVTFVVSSPTGEAVLDVFVLGEGGIVADKPAARAPAQLQVLIPQKLSPGEYAVSAVGKTSTGEEAAAEVILDVEMDGVRGHQTESSPGATPSALKADSSPVILQSQGQQLPLQIHAVYSNGESVDVTESSNLVLQSANSNIARVNAERMIVAVNRGETTITAIYLEGGRSVRATIPVRVEAEIVTVSPSQLSFGSDRGVPVGTRVQQQLVLTYHTSNTSLRITGVKIVGDFSQINDCVSSSAVRKETTCTVTVTFHPTQAGTRLGELSLSDNWTIAPTTIPFVGRAIPR